MWSKSLLKEGNEILWGGSHLHSSSSAKTSVTSLRSSGQKDICNNHVLLVILKFILLHVSYLKLNCSILRTTGSLEVLLRLSCKCDAWHIVAEPRSNARTALEELIESLSVSQGFQPLSQSQQQSLKQNGTGQLDSTIDEKHINSGPPSRGHISQRDNRLKETAKMPLRAEESPLVQPRHIEGLHLESLPLEKRHNVEEVSLLVPCTCRFIISFIIINKREIKHL